jgi:hypothetical protein
VLRTLQNMAALRGSAGDPAGAVEVLSDVEPRLRAVNGSDHSDVVVLLRNKGLYLRKCARFREADAAFAEALAIAVRVHGADHAEVARTRLEWALSLNDQKRWAESEKLLEAAFPVVRSAFGEEHLRTRTAAKALVAVYEATLRSEQAESLRHLVD